jgi:hypothetical protein
MKEPFPRRRQLAVIWTLACALILVATALAQTKPAPKSITVYQDPG